MTPKDIFERIAAPLAIVLLIGIGGLLARLLLKRFPALRTSFELSGAMKLLIVVLAIAAFFVVWRIL